jgi:hypothetical protein
VTHAGFSQIHAGSGSSARNRVTAGRTGGIGSNASNSNDNDDDNATSLTPSWSAAVSTNESATDTPTCASSSSRRDTRSRTRAGSRSTVNVPSSSATRTAADNNNSTTTRSGGASVSSMGSDDAVVPTSQRRRMTRSMARARDRAKKADNDVDAEDKTKTQPPAKSTRSSRKQARPSSPDRKKSASKSTPEVKQEDDESKKCCICLDLPTEKELSKLDGCKHTYCFTCIEKWAERENTCPQCKARFFKIERVHKVKRKRSNSTSPKVTNVKKVKTRDQRADYRQQNLQGFFANMEAYGLQGLNILFSSGPPGVFDGPGEPILFPNTNRGDAGGGGTTTASAGPTASSIAASIGLFSPTMTRSFSVGIPGFTTHANTHPVRASSRTPSSATRPSIHQQSRRTARFSRMGVRDGNNSWRGSNGVVGGGGSALNNAGNSAVADSPHSFIQRVANLNRDQERLRHLRTSRNQMPNARDAAVAAAASFAESVFDSGMAVGRSTRNRNSNWRMNSGVRNVLELLDDSDDVLELLDDSDDE